VEILDGVGRPVCAGGVGRMIAAPAKCDVEGVRRGSLSERVPPMGGTTPPSPSSGPNPPTRSSAKSPADKPPSTGSPNPRHTTRASAAAGPTPVGWRETRETRAAEPYSVHQGHSSADMAFLAPPPALSAAGGTPPTAHTVH